MSVYIISDHAGIALKQYILDLGLEIVDLSPVNDPSDDYPDFARILAKKLSSEPNSQGIAVCGSGQGMCMSMNRYNHIRAGLVIQQKQIKNLIFHNNANVICLSQEFTLKKDIKVIISEFKNLKFSNEERHIRRLIKMNNLV